MTTFSWNSPMRITNDAEFQSWANGVSQAFNALLTKTSDTGQLTPPITAAKPTSTNTYVGYEIFRFNDAYQSTYPVFLKVQYGHGGDINRPAVAIQMGTGSNGSGTITNGKLGPDTHMSNNTASDTRVMEHAACFKDGAFWIAWAVTDQTNGSCSHFYHIERMRNPDGTPKPGVWIGRVQQSSGSATQNYFSGVPETLSPQHVSGEWPIMYPASSGDFLSVGGDVPLFPIEPFLGRRQPPCLGMCGVRMEDVGQGVVMQTTLLGATRLFRRITGSHLSNASSYGKGTHNNKAMAGRWE